MGEITQSHPQPRPHSERQALIRERLAAKPDGVLEAIARDLGVPTQLVLEACPPEQRIFVAPDAFEQVWAEMTGWGAVTFIVHTPDIVLECVGPLPAGTNAMGYFNIHGDSPIGGHIKAVNCRAIYIVDRLFHGRRSCSVQVFNADGEAMFKVFVRRDEKRELVAAQLAQFESFKAGRLACG